MPKPKLPSFFKLHKHQKFDYFPRYYDPKKEKLDAQVERKKEELRTGRQSIKFDSRNADGANQKNLIGLRLIIILIVLIAVFYWLLFY